MLLKYIILSLIVSGRLCAMDEKEVAWWTGISYGELVDCHDFEKQGQTAIALPMPLSIALPDECKEDKQLVDEQFHLEGMQTAPVYDLLQDEDDVLPDDIGQERSKQQDRVRWTIVTVCPQCHQLFSSSLEMQRHYFKKHGLRNSAGTLCMKCDACTIMRVNVYDLLEHRWRRHRLKPNEISRNLSVEAAGKRGKYNKRNHTCQVCNKTYKSPKKLYERHMKSHGITDFICLLCKKTFGRMDYLVQHRKREHEIGLYGIDRSRYNKSIKRSRVQPKICQEAKNMNEAVLQLQEAHDSFVHNGTQEFDGE